MTLTEQTQQEISDAIDTAQRQEPGSGEINVTVSKKRKKIEPINPFALCFAESLGQLIVARKIGAPAMAVLFKLLALAQQGNLVSVNQKGIAASLGVDKSAVSRAINQLIKAGVLLEMPEGIFFNPQLVNRWGLDAVAKRFPKTVTAGIEALKAHKMGANWAVPEDEAKK
ncbi:helix-turn-helix domain-containing protein [Thermomonas sp. HDW16]|uniref:helix-turn-helix domain-containing protein n=1 Tax=Thermomonas sp. HDW16 TaxID=2714945 RepID=UPI0014082CDC|nr:helix-turn-helix domain-containing protein [Thermomonas sp. HDW16]QIL21008.1 helix-turn-helix domain-containing protein [Thermomonas sp. HDW16]